VAESDGEVPQTAEADNAEPRPLPHAVGAERLPDGDAGAHQGRHTRRIQGGRAVIDEAVADDIAPGVAAERRAPVDAVPATVGEGRELQAGVLLAAQTHGAGSARVDDVADGDGIAGGEGRHLGADGDDLPDELVSGHESGRGSRGGEGVQVAVADAAVRDPHVDIVRAEVAAVDDGRSKGAGSSGGHEGGCAHGLILPTSW